MEPFHKTRPIIESLQLWYATFQGSRDAFNEHFPKYAGFQFECTCDQEVQDHHVYFGIVRDDYNVLKFALYILPDTYDKEGWIEGADIHKAIAETELPDLKSPIDPEIAVRRIENWKKNGRDWMVRQTSIFQAIFIPKTNFSSGINRFTAYFALKDSNEFDLVLYKDDDQAIHNVYIYYDTVRLIPPFNPYQHLLNQVARSEKVMTT